ncbi:MAG: hypothetical protein ACXAC7_17720 [Candidatus Hodarchaeales archaeon]
MNSLFLIFGGIFLLIIIIALIQESNKAKNNKQIMSLWLRQNGYRVQYTSGIFGKFGELIATNRQNHQIKVTKRKIDQYNSIFVFKISCTNRFGLEFNINRRGFFSSIFNGSKKSRFLQKFKIKSRQKGEVVKIIENPRIKNSLNILLNYIKSIEASQFYRTIQIEVNAKCLNFTSILSLLHNLEELLCLNKKVESVSTLPKSINTIDFSPSSHSCVICWGKIDFSRFTTLYECCSRYAHTSHAKEWKKIRNICPYCLTRYPYIIELPKVVTFEKNKNFASKDQALV